MKTQEYENRITVLLAEIEKQTIIFSDKARETEAWKNRFE